MSDVSCCYMVDGAPCRNDPVTERRIELRRTPPCPDWLSVSLCVWHDHAVEMWDYAEESRDA